MNLLKKVLISTMAISCVLTASTITSCAEGDAPDVRTLTSAMESTYDKDAYVSVNLFVQPDWRGANDYGIGLDFTADGQPLSTFTMRDELLYWATHGKEAGTQKDNPTHVAKDNFRIPAANWDFSVEVGSQLPDDSVEAFCYQSNVNIEKGKVYTIYAIYGTKDWVEQNKSKVIPLNYVNMGSTLTADTEEQDSTQASTVSPALRGEPKDEKGIMSPSSFSNPDDLKTYISTKLRDADLVYYEYPGNMTHQYIFTGITYKDYYKLSDKDKAGFNEYLTKNPPSKDSSTIDFVLRQYCDQNNITLSTGTIKTPTAKKNVLASTKQSTKVPVKGIVITVIIIGIVVFGLIKGKKKK